jgi:hypothetical protein
VFDIFLVPVFVRALALAAWRRSAAGLFFTSAATCLWCLLLAAGWYGRGADVNGGAMVLIFLGPSATPGSSASVPLSALLATHPIGAKAVLSALFAAAFVAAWRGALQFSPLSDESSRRKKLGLAFLMPSLLLFAQMVCLAITEVLASS